MTGWGQRLDAWTPKSVPAGIVTLFAALAVYFPIVAWFAVGRYGADAIYATLLAAGICWLAASLSLVIAGWCRDPRQRIAAVLGGMLVRMGLPLVAGLVLSRTHGVLAAHGIFGQIVAFYLFALVVETWLSFTAIGLASPAVRASSTGIAE